MGIPSWGVALAAAALVFAVGGCGDDGGSSSGGGASESGPAAPDGSYASETGPNEEKVTFDVEEGAITHLEGTVYSDCDGITSKESIEGDVDIPIEDDAVDYTAESNGATTKLTGSFDDGTFKGTFSYTRPDSSCPSEPLEVTASAD